MSDIAYTFYPKDTKAFKAKFENNLEDTVDTALKSLDIKYKYNIIQKQITPKTINSVIRDNRILPVKIILTNKQ